MKLRSRSRSRRCIIIQINTPIWIETKQEEVFNSFYFNQQSTKYVYFLFQQYLYHNHIQIIL